MLNIEKRNPVTDLALSSSQKSYCPSFILFTRQRFFKQVYKVKFFEIMLLLMMALRSSFIMAEFCETENLLHSLMFSD